jgi:hypothetical protein
VHLGSGSIEHAFEVNSAIVVLKHLGPVIAHAQAQQMKAIVELANRDVAPTINMKTTLATKSLSC